MKWNEKHCNIRDSGSEVFFKLIVLKNFEKLTEKHLCWSLILIRLQTKTKLQHKCFFMNVVKIFKKTFFTEHLRTSASVISWRFQIFLVENLKVNKNYQKITPFTIQFHSKNLTHFTNLNSLNIIKNTPPQISQKYISGWSQKKHLHCTISRRPK